MMCIYVCVCRVATKGGGVQELLFIIILVILMYACQCKHLESNTNFPFGDNKCISFISNQTTIIWLLLSAQESKES